MDYKLESANPFATLYTSTGGLELSGHGPSLERVGEGEWDKIICGGWREGVLQRSQWAVGQCFRGQLHLRLKMAKAQVWWFDFWLRFKLCAGAVWHTMEKGGNVKHCCHGKPGMTLDWDKCCGCGIEFNERRVGGLARRSSSETDVRTLTPAFDVTILSNLSLATIYSEALFRHQQNNLLTHSGDNREHQDIPPTTRPLNRQHHSAVT